MTDSQSMKTHGAWEVQRTIKLPALTRAVDARALEGKLTDVPGVRQVRADPERRRVRVLYDITGCDYQGLERVLADAGFVPLGGWWARLKSSWYQYTDTTGRENANVPSSPCCNRPPRR
jgi:copper chaperone CopZ